jgi:hypothetical protein
VAGISTEALLAVTTAVLSMVAQMASVELILVWLPNGVVKVDALAWAVAMLVAKDRPLAAPIFASQSSSVCGDFA